MGYLANAFREYWIRKKVEHPQEDENSVFDIKVARNDEQRVYVSADLVIEFLESIDKTQ